MPYRHDIDPIAIEIFDLAISWYWLFYPTSFFVVFILSFRSFQETSYLTKKTFLDHSIATWLSLIVGGRIGYVLIYNFDFFWQNPGYIYQFWTGGMSFHGAIFLCAIVNLLLAKNIRNLLQFTDVVCRYLPIALFLGRIGNFINGELWGRPSSLPWAMVFPSGGDVSRHPSQLYEAFGEGIILYLLLHLVPKNSKQGTVTAAFIGSYGVIRLILEIFREPDAQLGFYGPLTMGQILSVLMIFYSLFLYRTILSQTK